MAAPASTASAAAAAAGAVHDNAWVNRNDHKRRAFTDFEEGFARKGTSMGGSSQQYKLFLLEGHFDTVRSSNCI
jgi:hypothetical protein